MIKNKNLMRVLLSAVLLMCTITFAENSLAQQRKRAQTSMKFLSTSNFANASGMASAVTAMEGGVWTQFYNPSASAWSTSHFEVTGSVNNWIAGIKYTSAAISLTPLDGKLGVFGIQYTDVNYGELQSTIRANNERGYLDIGLFSPTAYAVGLSYAKSLSDRFAVGANYKRVKQDLGSGVIDFATDGSYLTQGYEATANVVDFGVFYRTGFRSLNFAMVVKNFSPDVRFDSQEHELPLTLKMGISMDLVDLTSIDKKYHSLIVNIDANRPRDYDEQIQIGGQYTFLNTFILRGGYLFPSDEEGFSLGFGIQRESKNRKLLKIDYSYSDFGIFSDVNRLSFQIAL